MNSISREIKRTKFLSSIKILFLLGIVFAFCITASQAQPNREGQFKYTSPGGAYIGSYFTDLDDFLVRPLKWNRYQYISATAITAAGAGLYFYDPEVRNFFIKKDSELLVGIDKWFLDPLGVGLWVIPVVGTMYFGGDERSAGTALAVVKAYGYGVGTAFAMKYFLQRARPSHFDPPNSTHWDGVFGKWEYDAFPSAHSLLSFAMATVIATEYNETIWVPALCYSLATLASLSRIQHGDHWPSDVLIGAAIGFGIGKFIHRTSKKPATQFKLSFN
ncbi:MAG: phosphatase PAP2 family protein [Bacteroidales bacterium]|nr:phosphatase PAP2 family protein [Bacteroidales bacterium]